MPFVFGSYEVSDADALTAALAFDEACLANYDFGGTSATDGVDLADIGRLIGSQMVGMAQSEAAALIAAGAGATWHKVPIDARLEEAAPGTPLFVAAMELYDYFQAIRRYRAGQGHEAAGDEEVGVVRRRRQPSGRALHRGCRAAGRESPDNRRRP